MSGEWKNNGGPAFPQFEVVATERDGHGDMIEAYTTATGGMSLRDWFAGQALAGYFAYCHAGHQNTATMPTAEYIYQMADAMIAARRASE
jgi:hypothetical protein